MGILSWVLTFPLLTSSSAGAPAPPLGRDLVRVVEKSAEVSWFEWIPCAAAALPQLHSFTMVRRSDWREPRITDLGCLERCFRGVFDGRIKLAPEGHGSMEERHRSSKTLYKQQIEKLQTENTELKAKVLV